MAISNTFHLATTASATNTTKVSAVIALPDNCHSIVIYNPDGTNDVYVAIEAAGAGALPVASSTIIPAGASLTLGIGVLSVNITYVCNTKI